MMFREKPIILARIILEKQRRCQPRTQRYWIRPCLARQLDYGPYNRIMTELQNEDVAAFQNFIRMDPAMFQEILTRVGPRIEKFETWYHKAINPGCRLAITFHFLATGAKYQSLMYGFCVAYNSIFRIVCECCDAIFDEYSAEVMHFPRTSAEWKAVARDFSSRWNFHHTLGAIDGKHVAIMMGHCIAATRVSTQSFCLPLWMPTTSSCGWMWVSMDQFLMHRYLTSRN